MIQGKREKKMEINAYVILGILKKVKYVINVIRTAKLVKMKQIIVYLAMKIKIGN